LVLNHTDISNTTFQGILSSWSFIPNFKGFHVDMPDLLVPIVKKLNWVEDVEPDQNILTFTSNLILDFFPDNWGLERISRRDTASAASIYVYPKNAGLKTNIYILDTGVRTSHSEFKGRARWGRDFTGSGKQTDDNGHGTHVAALAAGSSFGVAKSANIIAVKVLDSSGQGSVSNVISAINWVITDMKSYSGRSIINLSLGGSEKSSALNAVVASAKSAGIPFSVAAGNSNVNGRS
jgi:subtilisin family serine protease